MANLESEGQMTRRQAAAFLREFANELDGGTSDGDRTSFEGRGESAERREDYADEEVRDTGGTDEEAREPTRVTLIVGGDSATVTVPNAVNFNVEVGSRSPMLGSGVSQQVEFELSWDIENPDELDEDWIEVE